MLCFPSPNGTVTLCGAPIGLDWFDVALANDYRRISCRTCRGHWNYENPDAQLPVREQPYVQRFSVATTTETVKDLSWQEALDMYRDTYAYAADPEVIGRLHASIAYLMTGERVIAAFLTVDHEVVVDTRNGIGLEHLPSGGE